MPCESALPEFIASCHRHWCFKEGFFALHLNREVSVRSACTNDEHANKHDTSEWRYSNHPPTLPACKNVFARRGAGLLNRTTSHHWYRMLEMLLYCFCVKLVPPTTGANFILGVREAFSGLVSECCGFRINSRSCCCFAYYYYSSNKGVCRRIPAKTWTEFSP